jgi:hypothetical protein
MTEDQAWVSLLYACRSTLISLKLLLVRYLPEELLQITLPVLKCLEINYWADEPGLWPLNLKTPDLECHLESTDLTANDLPFHRGTSTVKKIGQDYPPRVGAFPSPRASPTQ